MQPIDILNTLYDTKEEDRQLKYLFLLIENKFSLKDLDFIDSLLTQFDPTRVTPIISVGLLRITFRAKMYFKYWGMCFIKVEESLKVEDRKRLLRGLN